MFLIEGTRGCPSQCPFCLLGNLYDFVYDKIDPSITDVTDMGILGGGVSFYPGIADGGKETQGKREKYSPPFHEG